MSATATTAGDSPGQLTTKQREILDYLRKHADSRMYFKSRLIGDDLGLSAKEVGANMAAIVETDTELDVEKWGYSSGTTWMVTQNSSPA